MPWYTSIEESYNGKNVEVCYWRECWGIRGDILHILHIDEDNSYHYNIESDNIPAIIKALEKYLNKEYWDANANSIWEYDEYFDNNIQNIRNLLWLKEYLEENPDAECYFYDSY